MANAPAALGGCEQTKGSATLQLADEMKPNHLGTMARCQQHPTPTVGRSPNAPTFSGDVIRNDQDLQIDVNEYGTKLVL